MSNNSLSISCVSGEIINSSYLTLNQEDQGVKKYAKLIAGTMAFPVLSVAAMAESVVFALLTTLAKTAQFLFPKTHSVKLDKYILNPLFARSVYAPAMIAVAFTRIFTNWRPETRARIDAAIVNKAADFHSSRPITFLRTVHFNGLSKAPEAPKAEPTIQDPSPTPVKPKTTDWKRVGKYALLGVVTVATLYIAWKYLKANTEAQKLPPAEPEKRPFPAGPYPESYQKGLSYEKPISTVPNLETCPVEKDFSAIGQSPIYKDACPALPKDPFAVTKEKGPIHSYAQGLTASIGQCPIELPKDPFAATKEKGPIHSYAHGLTSSIGQCPIELSIKDLFAATKEKGPIHSYAQGLATTEKNINELGQCLKPDSASYQLGLDWAKLESLWKKKQNTFFKFQTPAPNLETPPTKLEKMARCIERNNKALENPSNAFRLFSCKDLDKKLDEDSFRDAFYKKSKISIINKTFRELSRKFHSDKAALQIGKERADSIFQKIGAANESLEKHYDLIPKLLEELEKKATCIEKERLGGNESFKSYQILSCQNSPLVQSDASKEENCAAIRSTSEELLAKFNPTNLPLKKFDQARANFLLLKIGKAQKVLEKMYC